MKKLISLMALTVALSGCYTNSAGKKEFWLCSGDTQKPVATAPMSKAPESMTTIADNDKDGVADNVDKCLNTPTGTVVDTTGCSVESQTRAAASRGALKGVVFKTNSPELTDNSKKILDEVATTLTEFNNVAVEVQGHTDNTGNADHNTMLSQARAQTVADYLATKGVAKTRLSAKGFGSTAPVADNKTSTGRQQNRRVELKWLE